MRKLASMIDWDKALGGFDISEKAGVITRIVFVSLMLVAVPAMWLILVALITPFALINSFVVMVWIVKEIVRRNFTRSDIR